MPSPFPGMNPYLEHTDVWHDFHESLMPAFREQLTPQFDDRYVARIDEHIYIHDLVDDDRKLLGRADVGVTAMAGQAIPASVSTAVLDAPARVTLPGFDRESEAFIEIRDRQNRELITVIELLSPSNKRSGEDREQYVYKRNQLTSSGVNLVEVDLLRGGPRMPMKTLPKCDYCVMVCTQPEWPRAHVWPLLLRERLPIIPIPLRAGEVSARLDLKLAIDRVYDSAGYKNYIYSSSPEPPLSPDDAAWAAQFVPART